MLKRLQLSEACLKVELVRSLFESYFDTNIASKGVLPSICEILQKHELFGYFESGFSDSIFPTYLSKKNYMENYMENNCDEKNS